MESDIELVLTEIGTGLEIAMLMISQGAAMRHEIGPIRNDMGNLGSELRCELHSEIGSLRSELDREIGSFRKEMNLGLGAIIERLARIEGISSPRAFNQSLSLLVRQASQMQKRHIPKQLLPRRMKRNPLSIPKRWCMDSNSVPSLAD